MPIVISKNKMEAGLFNAVKEISGVNIAGCLQCKKCTNGCPVARQQYVTSQGT